LTLKPTTNHTVALISRKKETYYFKIEQNTIPITASILEYQKASEPKQRVLIYKINETRYIKLCSCLCSDTRIVSDCRPLSIPPQYSFSSLSRKQIRRWQTLLTYHTDAHSVSNQGDKLFN